ncbi:hypothetical protein [Amycolatopsis sp. NPDC057786]|uniref:hypothetical protein n=1 Tax=Amycolatopsis sp. NPDC057786 TaxID=3346250 RepID=UPI00366E17F4
MTEKPVRAWGILVGGLAVFVAAPALLLATGHDTIKPSADSDKELSLAGALIPALAGILLVHGIPLHAPKLLPDTTDRRRLRKQATALALIAFLWPLALFLVSVAGQQGLVRDIWALAKPLVFLLLPLLLLRTRGSPIRSGSSGCPGRPGDGSRRSRLYSCSAGSPSSARSPPRRITRIRCTWRWARR